MPDSCASCELMCHAMGSSTKRQRCVVQRSLLNLRLCGSCRFAVLQHHTCRLELRVEIENDHLGSLLAKAGETEAVDGKHVDCGMVSWAWLACWIDLVVCGWYDELVGREDAGGCRRVRRRW